MTMIERVAEAIKDAVDAYAEKEYGINSSPYVNSEVAARAAIQAVREHLVKSGDWFVSGDWFEECQGCNACRMIDAALNEHPSPGK